MARIIVTLAFMASSSLIYGQMKMKWLAGNFDSLKHENTLRIAFLFDSVRVDKHATLAEYIDVQKKEHEEKVAGGGEQWENDWQNNIKNIYEPKFSELFEKYSGLDVTQPASRFVLVFRTTRINTNYMSTMIDAEAWLIDNLHRENPPSKIGLSKVPGDCFHGYCYVLSDRLVQAYAKAGKSLGQYISNLKKGKAD